MGRPREFDTTEALEAAMGVFWLKGYESTSMTDLMAAMDLHKGSIYKAYGDKHQLFLAALGHYVRHLGSQMRTVMSTARSPKDAVEKWLALWLSESTGGEVAKGCFMMNSVVELAPHDPEVSKMIKSFIELGKTRLVSVIKEGQAIGEFRTDMSAEDIASYIVFVKAGLLTAGKLQLPSVNPASMVETAMQAVTAPPLAGAS